MRFCQCFFIENWTFYALTQSRESDVMRWVFVYTNARVYDYFLYDILYDTLTASPLIIGPCESEFNRRYYLSVIGLYINVDEHFDTTLVMTITNLITRALSQYRLKYVNCLSINVFSVFFFFFSSREKIPRFYLFDYFFLIKVIFALCLQ